MRRKRMRLKDFDYSSNGAYFVTICAQNRRTVFTNDEKHILETELLALRDRFSGLTIDTYVTMADHVHVIFMFDDCRSSLPEIIQAFKSLSTVSMKQHSAISRLWQRGYFDRMVRNDAELEALREYIRNNPIGAEIKGQGRASSAPT